MALNIITINFNECSPAPANGYQIRYRPQGSGIDYRDAGNFPSSPAVFNDNNDDEGTEYEGYLRADCGGGVYGGYIPWETGGGSPGATGHAVTIRIIGGETDYVDRAAVCAAFGSGCGTTAATLYVADADWVNYNDGISVDLWTDVDCTLHMMDAPLISNYKMIDNGTECFPNLWQGDTSGIVSAKRSIGCA